MTVKPYSLMLQVGDIVVHKKGGIYRVIAERSAHTETGEALVVYENTLNRRVWVRPECMFTSDRFRFIQDAGDWLK